MHTGQPAHIFGGWGWRGAWLLILLGVSRDQLLCRGKVNSSFKSFVLLFGVAFIVSLGDFCSIAHLISFLSSAWLLNTTEATYNCCISLPSAIGTPPIRWRDREPFTPNPCSRRILFIVVIVIAEVHVMLLVIQWDKFRRARALCRWTHGRCSCFFSF